MNEERDVTEEPTKKTRDGVVKPLGRDEKEPQREDTPRTRD